MNPNTYNSQAPVPPSVQVAPGVPVVTPTAQPEPGYAQPHEHISSCLVLAIIGVLLSLPFGILALVHSVAVEDAIRAGNLDKARRDSHQAKIWGIVAIVLGLAGNILYIALQFVGPNS